jgi:hypothetical protein
MTARVQLEKKISGRDNQGACGQDELTGGKPVNTQQTEKVFVCAVLNCSV